MKTLWVIIFILSVKCCQITIAASDSGPFIPQSKQALAAASKQQQQQHMDQQAQQSIQQQAQFKSDDIYNSDPYPPSASGLYPSADEDHYQDTAYESEPQPYSSDPITLDNPSYDPNLYQNFVPQDSVQQYVSSYGGPYPESVDGSTGIDHPIGSATGVGDFGSGPGIIGGATGFGHGGVGPNGFHGTGPGGFIPGGPVGFHGGGPVGFPVGGPLPPHGGPFGPPFLGPPGFSIQSGYEGYLVPHFPPPPPLPPPPPPPGFGPSSGALELLKAFVPRSLMGLFMRSGSYLLNTIAVVLFGGAVTTAVCTFTPMCTISFAALPLLGLRDTAKTIKDKLSKEVTSDRVSRAAEFVKNAFDKYQKLQTTMNWKNSGDAVKLITTTSSTPIVPSEISTTMLETNKKLDTKTKTKNKE